MDNKLQTCSKLCTTHMLFKKESCNFFGFFQDNFFVFSKALESCMLSAADCLPMYVQCLFQDKCLLQGKPFPRQVLFQGMTIFFPRSEVFFKPPVFFKKKSFSRLPAFFKVIKPFSREKRKKKVR